MPMELEITAIPFCRKLPLVCAYLSEEPRYKRELEDVGIN